MIDAGYSITEMKLILKSVLEPDLKLATWSSRLILLGFIVQKGREALHKMRCIC